MTTMEATECGFALCDSSAAKAVSKRRVGSLPFGIALGCSDIGEAKLTDGRRVLITLGRNIGRDEQFWFAHNTTFTPVWCGDNDGRCELILAETFAAGDSADWLWLGLRIVRESEPEWTQVREEE